MGLNFHFHLNGEAARALAPLLVTRLTGIEEKLDAVVSDVKQLQQITLEVKQLMATVSDQVKELSSAVNDLGVELDTNNTALQAEIVQINDALAKLAAANPELAASIEAIRTRTEGAKKLTETIHGIIADAPIVPSVT